MIDEYYHTFEEDVRNEEQREGDVVLYAVHAQVLNHAFDLCVANVGSVDVSLCVRTVRVSQEFQISPDDCIPTHHEVQKRQDRNKTNVDLANHLLPGLFRVVLVKVGLFGGKTDVRIFVVVDFDVVNLLEVLLHRVCRCSVGGLRRHGEYQAGVRCYWC